MAWCIAAWFMVQCVMPSWAGQIPMEPIGLLASCKNRAESRRQLLNIFYKYFRWDLQLLQLPVA
jgi:hypothetical protein